MKSLVEKLGIAPGPWEVYESEDGNSGFIDGYRHIVKHSSAWIEEAFCYEKATKESKVNDKLIAAAPEMLEALIDFLIVAELICEKNGNDFLITYHDQLKIIEKATGKTWEEVKEIINEK